MKLLGLFLPSTTLGCIWRWPLDLTWRKHRREREKRARGLYPTENSPAGQLWIQPFCPCLEVGIGTRHACGLPFAGFFLPLALSYPSCLLVSWPSVQHCPVHGFCARWEGVNHANLHLLRRASVSPSVITLHRMALINDHYVANKTILPKDFFLFEQVGFYVYNLVTGYNFGHNFWSIFISWWF